MQIQFRCIGEMIESEDYAVWTYVHDWFATQTSCHHIYDQKSG